MSTTDAPFPGIYAALVGVARDIHPVAKDSQNRQQGYRFRGIEAVAGMIQPLFAKHGVLMLPRVLDMDLDTYPTKSGGTMHRAVMTIAWRFTAADGSEVEIVTVGEGADAGDKACNKAMTASQKYAITLAFTVPWDQDEGDADSPEERAPQSQQRSQSSGRSQQGGRSQYINEAQAGKVIFEVVRAAGEGENAPRRQCLSECLAEVDLPNQWPEGESPKAWMQSNVPWKKMDALLAAIQDWAPASPAPEDAFN